MKKSNEKNEFLMELEEMELHSINGGGIWDTAKKVGKAISKGPGFGCGVGNAATKGFTGGGNYLEGAYGHR
ncbi:MULTISPECIES: hypothetical protein [Bacillus cereus group]|uniref:Uncharacterized protein n=1 Tax=Bacillus cereus VD048 TaxID=1053226 RepID=J8HKE7_BACCE|nr:MULTISPECIES: hypothetical protein [Bacillus cereus group]EJR26355.1 hypothetical protein IIG_05397 [Bacillus cereus VD048]WJE35275.1 hypothetical protein QRX95_02430 [Bacillus mycoides]